MPEKDKNLKQFLSRIPVEDFDKSYSQDITENSFYSFPIETILRAEENLLSSKIKSAAYFSMEYGLSSNTYNIPQRSEPTSKKNLSERHLVFSNLRSMDYYLSVNTGHLLDLPIYSGGLGVLAGDTVKSAADRGVSLVAVGILWNKGYFKQNFWFKDGQVPEENDWDPRSYPGLVPLKTRVEIPLKSETIHLRLWKYFVYSFDKKNVVPLILLDSNIEENSEATRTLTNQLYRSDNAQWKLYQRLILGVGGMKALEKLGYSINRYHMNEGHAALAFMEKAKSTPTDQLPALREIFAYTCHTPVEAGHDRFAKKVLQDILPEKDYEMVLKFGADTHYPDVINLTQHAMNTSKYVNAVAKKHGEVMRLQFPKEKDRIQHITNGVHSHTWASASFTALFDKYSSIIGDWRKNPDLLNNVLSLKEDFAFRQDVWAAHQENKKRLSALLRHWRIEPDVFTICWARRIAAYKRPSLILQDVHRLLDIAKRVGPIQIIFAGKSHPKDDLGFTYVNEMLSAIDALEKERDLIRVMMLENYDTYFGKLLSSGVDVWLNNPLPPFEASGTSGMKAILNGVLQLSTLDGWVVEAADKDIGWIFGWKHETSEVGDERDLKLWQDSNELYTTLEKVVSLYYLTNQKGHLDSDSAWIDKMVWAISEAGFFNTGRMVGQYEKNIWGF